MTYRPTPLSTDDVELPAALEPLVERLAQHVHDTWAQRRIDEGWTYGPERDDAAKTHPCLVPYEALPDAEQAYDRRTALETLRATVKLGYRITPPGDDAPR
jgi:hypothetical protein